MKVGIIGAGPGGYHAGIYLAQRGVEVYLFEKAKVGGTCLQVGCIPTKALVHGVKAKMSFDEAMDHKLQVVSSLTKDLKTQLTSLDGLHLIEEEVSFEDKNTLKTATQSYQVDKVIIASGTSSKVDYIPGYESPRVLDSTDILNLEEPPQELLVIGAGALGLELADILHHYGTEITLVAEEFLPGFDKDLKRRLQSLLKRKKVKIFEPFMGNKLVEEGQKISLEGLYKGKEKTISADYCLMAIGRKRNLDHLNLEKVGLKDEGGLKVNEDFQTSNEDIYAIGDVVANTFQLAHVAEAEGIHVAKVILGQKPTSFNKTIPAAVYTLDEVAMAGLTEQQCQDQGLDYISVKMPYGSNGRARCQEATTGFVKVIAQRQSHKLLGMHILGEHADLLIMQASLALTHGLTLEDLLKAIYPHPSLNELLSQCYEQLLLTE